VLVEISGAIWMQIVVSIVGILMMTALAYYRSWSKNADKAPTKMTHDPPAHPMVVAPR